MSTSAAAPPPLQYVSPPPITLLVIAFLLVFFFLGIFFVIFCKCCMQSMWQNRRGQAGAPMGPVGNADSPGIDPSIIQSFPTFTYSSVKDYRKEEYGLECAICLAEFENDSVLRLLTSCNHVFHQECIDLWLGSHKTCPVCRQALDSPEKSGRRRSGCGSDCSVLSTGHAIPENYPEDMHSITINDENEGMTRSNPTGQGETSYVVPRRESIVTFNTNDNDNDNDDKEEKFSRSHSTGHSIVRIREEAAEDRFTLRLPEHVRAKIIRGHNATKSCTTFGEHKSKTTQEIGSSQV